MKRNLVLIIIALIGINFSCQVQEERPKRPNLLFIFPDQFRPQAMGFVNEDPVLTPNIDKLASEGVYFPNAVSNRPLCTPYRGMLMTGKYCFSTNLQTNCNTSSRKYQNFLREDESCFSDVLKANGYDCGYIGKWHLDAPEGPDVDDWREAVWESYIPPGPKRHGFDFWHAYGCNNRHLDPYYWVNDAPREDTLFAKEWSPIHEANVAIDFISNKQNSTRDKNKPWALFVSMNPPHGPYHEVPQRYKDIYKDVPIEKLLTRPNVPKGKKGNAGRKSVVDYFACVTGVDEQIGRILDELEKSGQVENTIVVFTADHGEMMGGHGYMQKVVWYEESFRIPFIIRWPEKLKPGKNKTHFSVPDVMPTFLAMMGLEDKIPQDIEGENLVENVSGRAKTEPEFSLYLNPLSANALGGMRGLRNDQHTFVIERNNEGQAINYILYDNINDPYQLKNIADEHPELIEKFTKQIFEKIKDINDPWVVYAP